MTPKLRAYTRPSDGTGRFVRIFNPGGHPSGPDEYGGRGGERRRVLDASLPGAAVSEDLGGSSKYSIEDLED